jgi:hypothetical protein
MLKTLVKISADTAANHTADELETFEDLFKKNTEDELNGIPHEPFSFSPIDESAFNAAFANSTLEDHDESVFNEPTTAVAPKRPVTIPTATPEATTATTAATATTAVISPPPATATPVSANITSTIFAFNAKKQDAELPSLVTSPATSLVTAAFPSTAVSKEDAEENLLLWWKTARTAWVSPTSSSSNGSYSFKNQDEGIKIVKDLKKRGMISNHQTLSNPASIILTKGEKTLLDNALENLELIHWWKIANTRWIDSDGTGQGLGSYPCHDVHEATRVLEILQLRGILAKNKQGSGNSWIPLNLLEKSKVDHFFDTILRNNQNRLGNNNSYKIQKK